MTQHGNVDPLVTVERTFSLPFSLAERQGTVAQAARWRWA
jgi:hypothetical protein